MNYYRRYMADYQGATMALSLVEHGAYTLLLDFYYTEESPLPLDSDQLAIICRAIRLEERAAIEKVLAKYFTRRSDGWHNLRADHEIAASKTARENGSKAWSAGSKVKSDTGSDTGLDTGCDTGKVHPLNHSTTQPPKPSTTQVPDWVPAEAWAAFVEMRQKTKAALTEHAKKLVIAELAKLRAQGHDPGEALNRSTMHCWKSVFPPRGAPAKSADGKPVLSL